MGGKAAAGDISRRQGGFIFRTSPYRSISAAVISITLTSAAGYRGLLSLDLAQEAQYFAILYFLSSAGAFSAFSSLRGFMRAVGMIQHLNTVAARRRPASSLHGGWSHAMPPKISGIVAGGLPKLPRVITPAASAWAPISQLIPPPSSSPSRISPSPRRISRWRQRAAAGRPALRRGTSLE